MVEPKRIFVGEGAAEPTSGFEFARQLFSAHPVEYYFGVRRCQEGLDAINGTDASVVANFPGRGMSALDKEPRNCNLSSYYVSRMIDTGRLKPDVVLTTASPPDANGNRTLGTANGPLQSAIDSAPLVIVEEYQDIPVIPGAATIPAGKPVKVIPHKPAAFAPLSRPPSDLDYTCAEHIASLIESNIALQIGVGGIIEALGESLKSRHGLRIITGAVGSTVKYLHEQGCLARDELIQGTAVVGNQDILDWATSTENLRMVSSRTIHNPRWLATIPRFHAINIGLSVDLEGNVNAEKIGERRVSGKGGSPNFSAGAAKSRGGASIVALRTDRGNALVDKIHNPTISSHHVDFIVCEKGVVDLRGKTVTEKARSLEKLVS